MGLVILKGFVEVMGGRIWVESDFGKGSIFVFCVLLWVVMNFVSFFLNFENLFLLWVVFVKFRCKERLF